MLSVDQMMTRKRPLLKFMTNSLRLGNAFHHFIGLLWSLALNLSVAIHSYFWSWCICRVVPTILGKQPPLTKSQSVIPVSDEKILVIEKGVPLNESIWFLEVYTSNWYHALFGFEILFLFRDFECTSCLHRVLNNLFLFLQMLTNFLVSDLFFYTSIT